MPRKIRQLVAYLERAGFVNHGGKGSHRNFLHAESFSRVTISGRDGSDAKPYQEKEVRHAIQKAGHNETPSTEPEAGAD
jgi:predicted RNA binding protein YcfA (HicA-like mRNA interferase family)